jgi:hypothetical protein
MSPESELRFEIAKRVARAHVPIGSKDARGLKVVKNAA